MSPRVLGLCVVLIGLGACSDESATGDTEPAPTGFNFATRDASPPTANDTSTPSPQPDPGPSTSGCTEGGVCNDGDPCTYNDQCSGGVCGGTAIDCGDEAPCTTDTCEAGICKNQVTQGFCLIDGACWTNGQSNPTNACERCLADQANQGWSDAEGVACDDGDPCTVDSCVDGACASEPLVCPQTDNPCTTSVCVAGTCDEQPLTGEACEDGDPCTSGETCDKDTCSGGVPKDADGDGEVDTACGGTDCDDDDPDVSTADPEICSDAVDNDCDGLTDELDDDCTPEQETCTYHTDCYPWGLCGLWASTGTKLCSLPCAGDADCAGGQVCTKAPGSAQVGFCQDIGAGLKASGQPCATDSQCQSGQCVDGTCYSICFNEVHCTTPNMTCFAVGDLAAGQVSSICGPDFGNSVGQVCQTSPGVFDGSACSSGHCDLLAGAASNPPCSSLCRGEGDCGANSECNMVLLGGTPNSQSVPFDPQAQLPTYDAITACFSTQNIPSGTLPVGSVCTSNAQCTSNKCFALAPGNPTQYCTSYCTHDEECPATMQCKPELINGVSPWLNQAYAPGASCAAPGPNGAANRCGLFNGAWPCNCDSQCSTAGDCCDDFQSFCLNGVSGLSNASAYVLVRMCKLADPTP